MCLSKCHFMYIEARARTRCDPRISKPGKIVATKCSGSIAPPVGKKASARIELGRARYSVRAALLDPTFAGVLACAHAE